MGELCWMLSSQYCFCSKGTASCVLELEAPRVEISSGRRFEELLRPSLTLPIHCTVCSPGPMEDLAQRQLRVTGCETFTHNFE